MISDKIENLDQLHELKSKMELIESEIRELIGEDFDPEEFFGASGFAAQDDIEDEYGRDDFSPFGSFEDPQSFVVDLDQASDQEDERLAPQYYEEDGAMSEGMTSSEFDAKYHNHPEHDDVKAKLIQRAAKVYPEFTRGKDDNYKWFMKTNQTSHGNMKVSIDGQYIKFTAIFDFISPGFNQVQDADVIIRFHREDPTFATTIIHAAHAGYFQAENRVSANRFAKDLMPLMQDALKNLNREFAQGREGGYSEENRELIQKMSVKLKNVKANDVTGKGSL